MAAASQPLATQTAVDILKQGGNAIDAAIAANAMLSLVEPISCGPGGDLFSIIWDASSGQLHGLNASGRSPLGLTLDYFSENGHGMIPERGPLPVTVPGCVDGWYALHDRFGKLPMKEVLAPAIIYAREGFPVTEVISIQWEVAARDCLDFPNFTEVFMPGGQAPSKGEIFSNPDLADTLEQIAGGGRDAFYKGDISELIADYLKENGGFLTTEDLAEHTSEWIEPVSTDYRGYTVWELPPNCQGIAVLQLLNILEGFDLTSMGFGSTEHIHTFVEAKKLVYEDRARYYADPAFNELPLQHLISKGYASERKNLIDPDIAALSYEAGEPPLEQGDTIYLTTADRDGNMVSLIQSNCSWMGSGMIPDGLGFVLQNRGRFFSLQEDHFNVFAPGKRPFHTIIPAFITKNGAPYISFGVMGGAMQPQGQAQVLINMIDFGLNLQEAGDAPRIRHIDSSQPTGEKMTDGGTVNLEPGFSSEVVESLREKGHTLQIQMGAYGGYQAIMRDSVQQVYYGASESRKDGHAAGF